MTLLLTKMARRRAELTFEDGLAEMLDEQAVKMLHTKALTVVNIALER